MDRFTTAHHSTTGLRAKNEDAFLVKELYDRGLFLAVADGLGGQPHGEVASNAALEAIQQYLTRLHPDTLKIENLRKILSECFELAQYTIRKQVMDDDTFRGMGTTLSAVLICDDSYVIGNIGDSRVYLIGPDYSRQMTIDHTYIGEFEQKYHERVSFEFSQRYGNILTRVVNGQTDRPDIFPVGEDLFKLHEGETLLLCTDGLILDKSSREPEFMAAQVRISKSLPEAVSNLVRYTTEKGSTDNITVILARRNFTAPEKPPVPVKKAPPATDNVPPVRVPDLKPPLEKKGIPDPESRPPLSPHIPGAIPRTGHYPAGSPTKSDRPNPTGIPYFYSGSPAVPKSPPVKSPPPPDPLALYYGKIKASKTEDPSKDQVKQSPPLQTMADVPQKTTHSFRNKTLNLIGLVILVALSGLAILSIFDISPFKKEEIQSGQRILYDGKPVVATDGTATADGRSLLFSPESVNASREKYLLVLSHILTQGFNFQYLKAVITDLRNIRPSYLTDIRIVSWADLQRENLIEKGTPPQVALVQPGLIISATDSNKFLTLRYERDMEGSTDSIDYISKSAVHFFSSGLAIIAGKYFDAAFLVRMVEKNVFYVVTYDPEGAVVDNPLGFNPEMGSPALLSRQAPCSNSQLTPTFATYRNQPVIDITCPLPDARGCFRIGLPW